MFQLSARPRSLFLTSILLVLLLFLFGERPLPNTAARAQQTGGPQGTVISRDAQSATDQIMIKFAPATDLAALSQAQQDQLMARLSRAAGVELEFIRPMSGGAYVLGLPRRMAYDQVTAISSALAGEPGVNDAEPDSIKRVIGREGTTAASRSPDDPFFTNQWHYRYTPGAEEGINLPPAWDITVGDSATVVAVIDTGILAHADLQGRTVAGYDFIFDPAVANDGDGRDDDPSDPGDWEPRNFCYSGSPAYDSSWHGTHVAGTIGAATDNDRGVAGVNWRAKILPVRALGRCGGYTSDIIDGALWAAGIAVPGVPPNGNPADVLNLSLSGMRSCSPFEQNAFDRIVAAGTTVVVSAGNDNTNAENFSPASCKKVITVAATTRGGDRAAYSNYGNVVELSAPGGDSSAAVLSTANRGATVPRQDSYAYYAGTSMAAPHVAGVASLLIGQNSGLSPAQVLARLQSTARDFPGGSSCTTARCGSGIVDAFAALNSGPGATPTPTNTPVPDALDAPTLFDIDNEDGDGSFSVQWSAVVGAEWYKVKQNRGSSTWELVYEGPAVQLERSNLPDGSYCYRVRAFNNGTNSEWSSDKCTVVDSTVPATSTPTPTPTSTPIFEETVTPPTPRPPTDFSYIPVVRAPDG